MHDAALNLAPPRYNVPPRRDDFVGREATLRKLVGFICDDTVRLINLKGPGGIGKTRLAIEAARYVWSQHSDHFPHGIVFVDLAALDDATLVPGRILEELGVREVDGRPAERYLLEYLRTRSFLLILDNFEHLGRAEPLVAQILDVSSATQIIVTSRAWLNVRGVTTLDVKPLQGLVLRADGSSEGERDEGVELFIKRASSFYTFTSADYPYVTSICRYLDDIPLDIELAVARLHMFTPKELLLRLQSHGVLKELDHGPQDAPERQRSAHKSIAWSYDLLDVDEQHFFLRLATFVGGWNLEAAQSVCGEVGDNPELITELLKTLVRWSLVQVQYTDSLATRYRFLAPVREFAVEQRAGWSEVEVLRRRHAEYFFTLAERAAGELEGPGQRVWLGSLDADYDNLRVALQWAEHHDPALLVRMLEKLVLYWETRGNLREQAAWVARALAVFPGKPEHMFHTLLKLAGDSAVTGSGRSLSTAISHYQDSLAVARRLGDYVKICESLHALGTVLRRQGYFDQVSALLDEGLGLASHHEDPLWIGRILEEQGWVEFWRQDYQTAQNLFRRSLAISSEPTKPHKVFVIRQALAWALNNANSYGQARSECLACVRFWRMQWQVPIYNRAALSSMNLLNALAYQHDLPDEEVFAILEEHLAIARQIGHKQAEAYGLAYLSTYYRRRGDLVQAKRTIETCVAILRESGYSVQGWTARLAGILSEQGRHADAEHLLLESLEEARREGERPLLQRLMADLGQIVEAMGELEQARALYQESMGLAQELGLSLAVAGILRQLGRLAYTAGDYVLAQHYVCDSLSSLRDQKQLRMPFLGLSLAGCIAVSRQDNLRAVRLLAVAARAPTMNGWSHLDREGHKRAVEAARDALGQAAFEKAWSEGEALSIEQAVELVLTNSGNETLSSPQSLVSACASPAPPTSSFALRYDERRQIFFLNDRQIDLSPLERRLLVLLHNNRGKVCTYRECGRTLYPDEGTIDEPDDRYNKLISKIRRKLNKVMPGSGSLVKAHRGLGYYLDLPPE